MIATFGKTETATESVARQWDILCCMAATTTQHNSPVPLRFNIRSAKRCRMTAPTGPLKDVKIFDLTRVLAGPTCVQMLADLGADVIKIERPGAGDDTRGFAPPFMPGTKESAYFVGVNRNKRSVTLDIAKPEGQEIALRLIAQSDILVENFKVGALVKYGLGYD